MPLVFCCRSVNRLICSSLIPVYSILCAMYTINTIPISCQYCVNTMPILCQYHMIEMAVPLLRYPFFAFLFLRVICTTGSDILFYCTLLYKYPLPFYFHYSLPIMLYFLIYLLILNLFILNLT